MKSTEFIIPIPDEKILALSELKAFANNSFIVLQMIVEDILENG